MHYSLRAQNIKNLRWELYAKDFCLIVNDKRYEMSRALADFISPKISELHGSKENITCYKIETEVNGDFNKVIQYVVNNEIEINQDEKKYFLQVFHKLGNKSEFCCFSPHINEPPNCHNVFENIQVKFDFEMNYEQEKNYIVDHFKELYSKSKDSFYALNPTLINGMINSPNFNYLNDNSLLEFLLEIFEKNQKSKEYAYLFENVDFCKVSSNLMQQFLTAFGDKNFPKSVLQKLCSRLVEPLQFETQPEHKQLIENNQKLKKEVHVLQKENEKLKTENSKLLEENKELRKRPHTKGKSQRNKVKTIKSIPSPGKEGPSNEKLDPKNANSIQNSVTCPKLSKPNSESTCTNIEQQKSQNKSIGPPANQH